MSGPVPERARCSRCQAELTVAAGPCPHCGSVGHSPNAPAGDLPIAELAPTQSERAAADKLAQPPGATGSSHASSAGPKLKPSFADDSHVEAQPPVTSHFTFGIASLLLLTTLVSVVMAIFVAAPGLGIILAILATPALIRTGMVLSARKELGRITDHGTKISLFLGSLGVTLVIVFTTVSICCVAACASCLATFSVSGGGAESLLIPVMAISTLSTGGGVIWLFSYWIHRRWKRDTRQ